VKRDWIDNESAVLGDWEKPATVAASGAKGSGSGGAGA
jgi:hypothetical protein